jgi:hypothetical protein
MRAKGLSDLKNGYESASATILVRTSALVCQQQPKNLSGNIGL